VVRLALRASRVGLPALLRICPGLAWRLVPLASGPLRLVIRHPAHVQGCCAIMPRRPSGVRGMAFWPRELKLAGI